MREVCAAFRSEYCDAGLQKAMNICKTAKPLELAVCKTLASSPRQPIAVAAVPGASRTIMVASRHDRQPLCGSEALDSSRLRQRKFLASAFACSSVLQPLAHNAKQA